MEDAREFSSQDYFALLLRSHSRESEREREQITGRTEVDAKEGMIGGELCIIMNNSAVQERPIHSPEEGSCTSAESSKNSGWTKEEGECCTVIV